VDLVAEMRSLSDRTFRYFISAWTWRPTTGRWTTRSPAWSAAAYWRRCA